LTTLEEEVIAKRRDPCGKLATVAVNRDSSHSKLGADFKRLFAYFSPLVQNTMNKLQY